MSIRRFRGAFYIANANQGSNVLTLEVHPKFSKAMSQAIIIMGVSGSGKTTIARKLSHAAGGCFIEGDQFHPKENVRKMTAGIALQDEDRKEWLKRLRNAIEARCTSDSFCFVACSALKKSYRDYLRRASVKVVFVYLTGPAELILKRMKTREGHFMPPELLRSQIATLETPRNAIVADIAPSPAEIVQGLLAKLRLSGNGAANFPSKATPRTAEAGYDALGREISRGSFPPESMKNNVYKIIELTGTSTVSVEDAVNGAIKRAGKKIKHLRWFQIIKTRGDIDKNAVKHWQVTIKVGFTVED